MFLAVTCHLHFWQNDQDLLCATAVTDMDYRTFNTCAIQYIYICDAVKSVHHLCKINLPRL